MRWLIFVLIGSVGALVVLSGGLALHIRRQHKQPTERARTLKHDESELESEEAP